MLENQGKSIQIRNSTVDFLVFTEQRGGDGLEVRVQDGNVWLTQDGMAALYSIGRSVVTKHLGKIFKSGELEKDSVRAYFAQTAHD